MATGPLAPPTVDEPCRDTTSVKLRPVLCQARIALKPCDLRCIGELVIIGIMSSLPLHFLLLTVAGWMTRDSQRVMQYVLAENAVLREQVARHSGPVANHLSDTGERFIHQVCEPVASGAARAASCNSIGLPSGSSSWI